MDFFQIAKKRSFVVAGWNRARIKKPASSLVATSGSFVRCHHFLPGLQVEQNVDDFLKDIHHATENLNGSVKHHTSPIMSKGCCRRVGLNVNPNRSGSRSLHLPDAPPARAVMVFLQKMREGVYGERKGLGQAGNRGYGDERSGVRDQVDSRRRLATPCRHTRRVGFK